jgi:hypothetical protein
VVLLATREHDNGWSEVDADPTIDPRTSRPCDFMSGPAAVKHELWPRGITRIARTNPRAGALIAQHAITVYAYREGDAEWSRFFAELASIRDALLERMDSATPDARRAFDDEYRVVRLGDALSLQFCNAWPEPQTTLDYTARVDGNTLLIAPDPFAGATIPLRVIARRIPARQYRDDADLRAAFANATPEIVVGFARGGA